MPTYEYFCETCEQSFDAVQKFTDTPLTSCPTGHESVRRVFRPAGIIFKGSGWYIKDSKGSSTVSGSGSRKSEAASESSKSDTTGESPKSDASSKSEPSSTSTGDSKGDSKSPVASEAA